VAVEALRQGAYAAVLMDCEMPEMDGYEAARQIRACGAGAQNANIPIIALTANALPEARTRCLQAGMNDYVSKPMEPERLAALLEKWLSRAPDAAPPVFNDQELLHRFLDDRNVAGRIVAAFLKDAPLKLRRLSERIAEGDGPGVRLQAHALKGAAAAISAPALCAIAREAEQAAKAGELQHAGELMPGLREQLERLEKAVRSCGFDCSPEPNAECR